MSSSSSEALRFASWVRPSWAASCASCMPELLAVGQRRSEGADRILERCAEPACGCLVEHRVVECTIGQGRGLALGDAQVRRGLVEGSGRFTHLVGSGDLRRPRQITVAQTTHVGCEPQQRPADEARERGDEQDRQSDHHRDRRAGVACVGRCSCADRAGGVGDVRSGGPDEIEVQL